MKCLSNFEVVVIMIGALGLALLGAVSAGSYVRGQLDRVTTELSASR